MSYTVALQCPGLQRWGGQRLQLLGVSTTYSTTTINMSAKPCDRLDLLQRGVGGGWGGYVTGPYALQRHEKNKKKKHKIDIC